MALKKKKPLPEGVELHEYFEFEIVLKDAKPKVWRKFLIEKEATFDDLHDAIQVACGWECCHLHEFSTRGWGGEAISGDGDMDPFGEPDPSEKEAVVVPLTSYFSEDGPKSCVYVYDFGDDWDHDVKLKKVRELPEQFHRRLLGGGRAFPPEDCGGIGGYYDLVAIKAKKAAKEKLTPDEKELLSWVGKWDPERFDEEDVRSAFDR